jgi:hypothetical protein
MVKTEIKEFLVDVGEKKGIRASLPVSVCQVSGEGADAVRMYATLTADAAMLSSRYIYLRIRDLRHSATVSLNGYAIGMPTAEEPFYSYDIKDRLAEGDNLLEITFEGEENELLTAGIFGGVELVKFENQMIDSLHVESFVDGKNATVTIKLDTVGSGESVRAVATLVSGSGQIYYAGLTKGGGRITVKDPLFWWPRGVGIQNLYKLTVNLYGESEIEDTAEIRIGFAGLTTDGGRTEVNGEPFIPLGAVFGGVSAMTPEDERAEIGAYMAALFQAGVNTVVIPEGVGRICDSFYDMCDLYGIVAVHEISAMGSLIRARLIHQGYRPSVGMIDLVGCGDDIEKITEWLREVCAKTDVNYVDKESRPAIYTLPTERTLLELVPEGERNPFSAYLDPIREDMLEIISLASREYPYAADLSSLAYISRLSGARETERLLLADRLSSKRAIYDSRLAANGLLSTGMLDSAYRRKALYYALARSFAGTVLYATGSGGVLDFYVMRSERGDASCVAELRIVDRYGEPVFVQSVEVEVQKSSVTRIFSRDFTEKIKGREDELYLEYILKDETGILSSRIHLFCEVRKYKLAKARMKAEIAGADRRFTVTVSSDTLAIGVELLFGADGIQLSDNCFDLTKGVKKKLVLTTSRSTTKEALSELLGIRTVNGLLFK